MAGVKGQVQRRGVARRQAILEVAIDLFSTSGYRGTGIAAIAERVGITPSGVLHHFGSKDELLQAVIEERDARAGEPLAALRERHSLDAIRRAYVRLGRDIESKRELAALYTVLLSENLNRDDGLHEFFLRRTRTVRKLTRQLLRRAAQGGEIRPDVDIAALADEIIAFLEGAQLVWLQDPERVSIAGLYERYIEGVIERVARVGKRADQPT